MHGGPTDCGWKLTQNCLQPDWYKFCPGVITCASNNMEDASTDDEQSNSQTMPGVMIVMTIMKMMRKCKGQCHEHEITII